jgi:hypothetical protein
MKITIAVLAIVLSNLTVIADPWLGDARILAADEGYQWEAAVAHNSVHDEYLAVWTTDVSGAEEIHGVRVDSQGFPFLILGRLLAADGSTATSAFGIANGSLDCFRPRVAWNRETEQYLVVYEQDGPGNRTDIYGTFVDIAGRLVGGRLFADGFEDGYITYWAGDN